MSMMGKRRHHENYQGHRFHIDPMWYPAGIGNITRSRDVCITCIKISGDREWQKWQRDASLYR